MRRFAIKALATALMIGLIGMAACTQDDANSQETAASNSRWSWLDNTYWYVPTAYLLAVTSDPSIPAPIPVSDQTVYHIAHYEGGYFWGTTAVLYSSSTSSQSSGSTTPSCLQLVGSVTPEGAVHLTFTSLSGGNSTPTIGIGTMVKQGGAWTMENQMSATAIGSVLLTHWAYMYQCKAGDPCFASLPGVDTSIPDFLGPCVAG